MRTLDLAFRAWYYFRLGYGTYLGFAVGFVTFVSTTYYLTVERIPFLKTVFENFTLYIGVSFFVIVLFAIFLGWLHMKRTLAYSTQIKVDIEANPYYYMSSPGKETEVTWPFYEVLLKTMKKFLDREDLLTKEERDEIEDVLKKIEILRGGGFVGVPRQRHLSRQLNQKS